MGTTCELKAAKGVAGDGRMLELILFGAILVVCNVGLLQGRVMSGLVLYPDAVASGESWRLVTFPFIHVSLYNFLLDALSFLFLWSAVAEPQRRRRAVYLIACWAGNLLFPLLHSREIGTLGLCGLSGIAHGLMALVGLEMMASERRGSLMWYIGLINLLGVSLKSAAEVILGHCIFAGFHFGNIGVPIVEAHAGGIIGACLGYLLINARRLKLPQMQATN